MSPSKSAPANAATKANLDVLSHEHDAENTEPQQLISPTSPPQDNSTDLMTNQMQAAGEDSQNHVRETQRKKLEHQIKRKTQSLAKIQARLDKVRGEATQSVLAEKQGLRREIWDLEKRLKDLGPGEKRLKQRAAEKSAREKRLSEESGKAQGSSSVARDDSAMMAEGLSRVKSSGSGRTEGSSPMSRDDSVTTEGATSGAGGEGTAVCPIELD